MKTLETVLWNVFFCLTSLALITQTAVVILHRDIPPVSKLNTDLEREFMRPDWLNDNFQYYYDDVEIFINDEHLAGGGMCYITQSGEVYINWGLEERWTALTAGKSCMAHETGHWVDFNTGHPSETEEFHRAIDLAARMDSGIRCFPCVCEQCEEGEWGGYKEIYADLFQRESIGDIPAILWDWYLPYYLVGEESL